MPSVVKLVKRAARKLDWSQWWRYPWVWGVVIGCIFAIILAVAPDLSHDVVQHVRSEQRRLGQLGAALSGPMGEEGSTAQGTRTSGMFGSKKLEAECRQVLEETFGKPFDTVRPDFLKRPTTKRNLELDCYNAELRLALEYQGPQHRVYLPMYHPTEKHFHDQLERDAWKLQRCREEGIDLIVVPDTVPRDELRPWIFQQLRALGRL